MGSEQYFALCSGVMLDTQLFKFGSQCKVNEKLDMLASGVWLCLPESLEYEGRAVRQMAVQWRGRGM